MKSCPELTSKANYLQVSVNCSLSNHHQKAQTCLMNAIIPYEILVFPQRAFAYILFLFLVCKKMSAEGRFLKLYSPLYRRDTKSPALSLSGKQLLIQCV